jgi:outer membrane protein insertion porin family
MIVGGSKSQKSLITSLFPLKPGQPFNRERIENFKADIDSRSIFSEIRVEPISRTSGVNDILIKATPDRGRFYGFGLGWAERKGLRGTFELHEKNIFNSTSSLSTMLQIGQNERRGIIAYDTPFFLNSRISSSFNLWEENEIFPSYRFTRGGIGASFIKRIYEKLYFVGSLKWYRTTLTELSILPFGVDQLDKPFDTTAFSLSFVRENRDDPFNPTLGDFISADLKIGLPIFEKNYTFLKAFWNYQKHVPILKNGVFSFSFRNGFGFGDMSITERFFVGGSHSFRGTRNDRLGPIHLDTDQPEGGNILILANLEATFPSLLIPVENLYYSVFADIGNVFPKSSDLNFAKMERAVGISLKYRTPIGPLRLDFAWNLRKAAEQNFLIFLGIGNVY